jgi:hypothetical protein
MIMFEKIGRLVETLATNAGFRHDILGRHQGQSVWRSSTR